MAAAATHVAESHESTDPSPEVLREMYRLMRIITGASNRASGEVRAGGLASAFYPVRGLVSTYRSLGDAIAKGASLRRVVAELYGRSDGVCGGKGGPMHLHDVDAGFVTSTGIVGSGAPIAVGLAIAAQLDGEGRAVISTFGDGATSIGAVHEALNMAALWRLPVVFVCQNNQWGEHTPLAQYAANPNLAERARSYSMNAVQVDGFDPIATYRVLDDALSRARAGGGPTFVEALTYRLTGHSGSADYSYVPRDELEAALQRDPAPAFRTWLLGHGASEQELTELDAAVDAEVADAFDFAMASPLPSPDLRYVDVFADRKVVPLT
jgi:pyruvate dehydrogenase E1 component alpha subunit